MSTKKERGICDLDVGRGAYSIVGKGFFLVTFLVIALFTVFNLNGKSVSYAVDCNCGFCHGDNHHGDNWTGCSGCHDSPPQTGTHLVHYNTGTPYTSQVYANYGTTTVTSTDDKYQFSCGNCHPLDRSKHNDGTVQVELYDAASPAGSIKALNPSSAAYTPGGTVTTYASKLAGGRSLSYSNGACNNIYCHSGYTVTSGPVGDPLVDGSGNYILDADGNLTYDPYTVNKTKVYKTTPPWGTMGTFSTCTECHDFPLTTSYPSVNAGVGDSHQWIDEYGYGNLHAFNMGYNPINCSTCHYGTVSQANIWTRNFNDVTSYNLVPLASRIYHVNGVTDVVFDTSVANNPLPYYPDPSSLSGASYDSSTKTCSNVSCHQVQTKVKWGSPYRWWDSGECNLCHHN